LTDTVAKRSDASEKMLTASAKGRALMGGTDAMRMAGEKFLPKFEAESHEAYRARLGGSWLFNGYRKTTRDMTGRVFDKPVEAVEVPSSIKDMLDNVDLQGRDLSTWARDVFEDGLSGCGMTWIMVDAPPRQGVVTKAAAQSGNLRPYLVHLKIEDMLGWRVETVDNAPKLTMLRVMETVNERDPADEFADVQIDQVRVLDIPGDQGGRVRTRLYRKRSEGAAERWEQVGDETYSDLTEITVVPFYANRTGFWQAEPLLDDLADINIAHWQSQSDQRNILHFARVPILVRTGIDSEAAPVSIGAARSMDFSAPDADVKWVEHSGQAIGAGRQDLKDLEFQMETHGLQLLAARAQSATGEALDAAKETSQLAAIADALQDAIEQALVWMAAYAGEREAEVSVTVNKDFGVSMMTAQEVGVMLNAVQTGNLSRQTFIEEMVRRGMLRSDLDAEEEAERITMDPPSLTGDPMQLGSDQQDEEDDAAA
jgi:hypothetical protein